VRQRHQVAPWRYLLNAVFATVVFSTAGVVNPGAPADADIGVADSFVDPLAEAADTPDLDWIGCGDGFLCATAAVPMDYKAPHGEHIDLAVIKLPATGKRIGTLFVNFGGPGNSGVDRLRQRATWPWLFSEELRSRFDLVSWDQRGVARSAAVRCFPDDAEQWRYLVPSPGLPADAAGENQLFSWAQGFADRCRDHAGPILDHASSANSARDLELLRRAVGDPALTYHGISYGTQLGAIYANLFPGRVRAMVFDGSLDFQGNISGHGSDGTTIPLNTRQGVPTGTASAFDQFLRDCAAAGPRCAFAAGDPRAKWRTLTDRFRDSSVVVYGRPWTLPEIAAATLAVPDSYPQLAELLQQFYETNTAPAQLIDDVTGISPPPEAVAQLYLSNREEAYNAIQCTDSIVPTDPEEYRRASSAAAKFASDFGRISVFDTIPCAFWPGHDVDRYTGPWNRRTAAPILVLNTRNDPATPLDGAYAGADELAQARVVVTEGAGHTSMYVASTCTEAVKRSYLFTGVLPPEGTGCHRDGSPFH
jgi:pimeloyl-ACP methyl ester carboxylesterase